MTAMEEKTEEFRGQMKMLIAGTAADMKETFHIVAEQVTATPTEDIVAEFAHGLKAENGALRTATVYLIGALGEEYGTLSMINALTDALSDKKVDPRIRETAAHWLGKIGNEHKISMGLIHASMAQALRTETDGNTINALIASLESFQQAHMDGMQAQATAKIAPPPQPR